MIMETIQIWLLDVVVQAYIQSFCFAMLTLCEGNITLFGDKIRELK